MADNNTSTAAALQENPCQNQNNNPAESSEPIAEPEYTKRQILSSFQPALAAHLQQLQAAPEQQVIEHFRSLQLGEQVKSDPQSSTNSQQPENICNETTSQQLGDNAGAPLTDESQGKPTTSWNPDANAFSPSLPANVPNEPKTTSVSNEREKNQAETPQTKSLIFDLSKYKHDYFISNLSCEFDRENARFNSPTGITALPDDRLVVANYDRDCLFLLDIKGRVHKIYSKIPAPKDVLYYSSTASSVVVATKKDLSILDLETGQIVAQTKLRGFYPWNVQYIEQAGTFAACDPSGERIVYFDKNLAESGSWSFNTQAQHNANNLPGQTYQKTYPYAARFMPDDSAIVFSHLGAATQLIEYDVPTIAMKCTYPIPAAMISYSIFFDSARKYLLADKPNHRLVCIKPDASMQEFKRKSIQEPYSMTFLSTGTLCVTCWNKSYGTNGGISINSEVNIENLA